MSSPKKVSPVDEESVDRLDRISDLTQANRLTNNQNRDPNQPISSSSSSGTNNKSWEVFKNQARAVFLKNYALQAKAKGTNCCQIATPLICLFLVFLIKIIAQNKISSQPIATPAGEPFLLNSDYMLELKATDCLQWYLYDYPGASTQQLSYVNTLLNNVFANIDDKSVFYCSKSGNTTPYFLPTVNGTINNQIFTDLEYLNTVEFNMTAQQEVPGLEVLPDGAILFNQASTNGLNFNVQIDDNRIKQYHRNNGVTKVLTGHNNNSNMLVPLGQLGLIDLISKAAINQIDSSSFIASGTITMPSITYANNILNTIFSITGALLYPFALCLMLPVFMYNIVLEKEERLQEMMKMNGLRMLNYWALNYIWNFMLYFAAIIVFFLFGFVILQANFFTSTSFAGLLLTFIGWGLSQVSLGFFFQTFIGKSRTATIVGYVLAVYNTMIGLSFNLAIYPQPEVLPVGLRYYPPFAFCRLVYDFSLQCSNYGCYQSLSSISDEMKDCLAGLYLGAVGFMAIAMYLHAVWPKEYGIRYHPLFCFKRFRNKQAIYNLSMLEGSEEQLNEDEDSKKEKQYVDSINENEYKEFPLIIKNIRKVYKSEEGRPPKVAVQKFSLHINHGEMFGLLGPNGAGKTTLISMLTGLYPPEAGNAWVAGYDILNQIDEVRREMGVCPQFDLLWPELTIAEHLYFYARIRGVKNELENETVQKAAAEVKLEKFLNYQVKQLSGGMKRRLSVAISLVGDPKIIFLDEPTTGLDPENRRQLWDILTETRGNRAVVLTTHSMEEADVLCNRIGIITDGVLRCIGQQTRLKTLYGGGYHLFINCTKDEYTKDGKLKLEHPLSHYHAAIDSFVKKISPNCVQKAAFNGNFVYLLPLENLEVSKIFEELEVSRASLGVEDWGISQATLEDVFMEIVNTSEQVHVVEENS